MLSESVAAAKRRGFAAETRRNMKSLSFLWLLLFCTVGASAQDPAPSPEPVLAEYADAVLAADMVRSCKPFMDLKDDSTLTQKRTAMNEPDMRHAFDLVRGWLARFTAPRTQYDPLAPAFGRTHGGIRLLGQAFLIRQYVLMADGRISEAIDVTRDAIVMSRAWSGENLTSWLSAVAIVEKMTKALVDNHLEQLSVRDCERLRILAEDWEKAPSTLPSVMERGRLEHIATFEKLFARTNATDLRQQLQSVFDAKPNARIADRIAQTDDQGLKQMLAGIEHYIDRMYRDVQVALDAPYWERAPDARIEVDRDDAGGAIGAVMVGPYNGVINRGTRLKATMRMLGCHAAIRRYRWEHMKLPGTLKELKLGRMAIDPFSGQEFLYKTAGGTHYALESVGPWARDDTGALVPGQRKAIVQTPGG